MTLFLIAINSLFNVIKEPVERILFADDLAIFYCSNNMDEIHLILQNALNNLNEWMKNTGFKFSEQKTVALCFTRKYNIPILPNLLLNNIRINFVNSDGLHIQKE